MQTNSESLDHLDQQTEDSLGRLNELWRLTDALPILQKQSLIELLEAHCLSLEEVQAALEELRASVSELAAARQQLEAERLRYQELFELAPDGYLVTDPDALILEANQAAATLLNCSQQKLIGKLLANFLPHDARRHFCTQLNELPTANKAKEWEAEIQHRNGASFTALFKVAVVCNAHNRVVGLRWSVKDISARKQYEAGLQNARLQLEKQMREQTLEVVKFNEQLKQEIAERQRMEAALLKQGQQERLIAAIGQRLSQSLKLEEILNSTVAEVRQFLECDRVVIYRAESSSVASVVAESVAPAWVALLGVNTTMPLSREGVAYLQENALAIEDMHQAGLPTTIQEISQQQQIKASLTVPILHGNQFWGLLAVHQCSQARHWQHLEVDLLGRLATQLSIVIQQSELYQQLLQLNVNLERQVQERTAQWQQALEFEAMLKRITDKVRDSLDESQILQAAVQELTIGLSLEGCNAAWYNLDQGTSTICYEYVTSIPGSHGRVAQMANFPEIYNQLLRGQYFQFCSVMPNPVRGHVVMLACPIMNDEGVLGDLWLINHKEYTFNDLEIRLVQQVANQCAIAIRQARLYQAATAQVKELEKLNQLKDDFLSTVSHELRTPIANMKMAIQMLGITLNRDQDLFAELKKPEAEQSRAARYFQILHNECERELSLINNLLDLQRLYAGVQPLVLTSIPLQDWLPKIVEPFQERAQNSQQSLQITISPSVPNFICDPASLGRVLAELLNNACKYTPPGEEIVLKAETKSEMLYLSVINSGVEIPESERARIFDKFYRIPSNDPWKQGGTGLGLTLVKQLVTHMGGTISVDSVARTTCFSLQLPLKKEGVGSRE